MEHKPCTKEPLSLILTIIPLGGQSFFSSFSRGKSRLGDIMCPMQTQCTAGIQTQPAPRPMPLPTTVYGPALPPTFPITSGILQPLSFKLLTCKMGKHYLPSKTTVRIQ